MREGERNDADLFLDPMINEAGDEIEIDDVIPPSLMEAICESLLDEHDQDSSV